MKYGRKKIMIKVDENGNVIEVEEPTKDKKKIKINIGKIGKIIFKLFQWYCYIIGILFIIGLLFC